MSSTVKKCLLAGVAALLPLHGAEAGAWDFVSPGLQGLNTPDAPSSSPATQSPFVSKDLQGLNDSAANKPVLAEQSFKGAQEEKGTGAAAQEYARSNGSSTKSDVKSGGAENALPQSSFSGGASQEVPSRDSSAGIHSSSFISNLDYSKTMAWKDDFQPSFAGFGNSICQYYIITPMGPVYTMLPACKVNMEYTEPTVQVEVLATGRHSYLVDMNGIVGASSGMGNGTLPGFPDDPNAPIVGSDTGTASWYGPGFDGKRAADGSIFDQDGMTMASNNLPLGSMVRVTNLETGKSVVVKVTDHGAFDKKYGRVADMSKGAAEQLGFVQQGTAPVKLDVIQMGDNKYHAGSGAGQVASSEGPGTATFYAPVERTAFSRSYPASMDVLRVDGFQGGEEADAPASAAPGQPLYLGAGERGTTAEVWNQTASAFGRATGSLTQAGDGFQQASCKIDNYMNGTNNACDGSSAAASVQNAVSGTQSQTVPTPTAAAATRAVPAPYVFNPGGGLFFNHAHVWGVSPQARFDSSASDMQAKRSMACDIAKVMSLTGGYWPAMTALMIPTPDIFLLALPQPAVVAMLEPSFRALWFRGSPVMAGNTTLAALYLSEDDSSWADLTGKGASGGVTNAANGGQGSELSRPYVAGQDGLQSAAGSNAQQGSGLTGSSPVVSENGATTYAYTGGDSHYRPLSEQPIVADGTPVQGQAAATQAPAPSSSGGGFVDALQRQGDGVSFRSMPIIPLTRVFPARMDMLRVDGLQGFGDVVGAGSDALGQAQTAATQAVTSQATDVVRQGADQLLGSQAGGAVSQLGSSVMSSSAGGLQQSITQQGSSAALGAIQQAAGSTLGSGVGDLTGSSMGALNGGNLTQAATQAAQNAALGVVGSTGQNLLGGLSTGSSLGGLASGFGGGSVGSMGSVLGAMTTELSTITDTGTGGGMAQTGPLASSGGGTANMMPSSVDAMTGGMDDSSPDARFCTQGYRMVDAAENQFSAQDHRYNGCIDGWGHYKPDNGYSLVVSDFMQAQALLGWRAYSKVKDTKIDLWKVQPDALKMLSPERPAGRFWNTEFNVDWPYQGKERLPVGADSFLWNNVNGGASLRLSELMAGGLQGDNGPQKSEGLIATYWKKTGCNVETCCDPNPLNPYARAVNPWQVSGYEDRDPTYGQLQDAASSSGAMSFEEAQSQYGDGFSNGGQMQGTAGGMTDAAGSGSTGGVTNENGVTTHAYTGGDAHYQPSSEVPINADGSVAGGTAGGATTYAYTGGSNAPIPTQAINVDGTPVGAAASAPSGQSGWTVAPAKAQ